MSKRNPGPAVSLEGVRLPVEDDQISAAREMLRENKGAQWSCCVSTGIQVGGNVDLRDNLVALLVEFDVPMATISDMFGLNGQEVWAIATSEPVSVFWCLDCREPLRVRDRRDLLRLRRALRSMLRSPPRRARGLELAVRLLHHPAPSALQRGAATKAARPAGENRAAAEDALRRVQATARVAGTEDRQAG